MTVFEIPPPPPQKVCRGTYSFLRGLLPYFDCLPHIFNVNNIPEKTLVVSDTTNNFTGRFSMKGWFALMKPELFIRGMVVAAMMIGGCKSSPTGGGGGNTLSAPTPAFPTNGSTNQTTSPTLTWGAVTGATAYDMRVSTVATFASVFSSQTTLTALSASVSGLANSTTYYWEVSATNGSETSAWSSVWSFTTSSSTNTAVPGVPVLVSPLNGATGQSVAPAMSWSSGSGGAVVSYAVEVSVSASFGSFIVNQTGVTAGGMTLSGLSNTTSYYWRVNATNANGTSAWTSGWSFTTIPGGTIVMGMVLSPAGRSRWDRIIRHWNHDEDEPVHSVTVSSFYMDTTEVTQASYQSLMGVNPRISIPEHRHRAGRWNT